MFHIYTFIYDLNNRGIHRWWGWHILFWWPKYILRVINILSQLQKLYTWQNFDTWPCLWHWYINNKILEHFCQVSYKFVHSLVIITTNRKSVNIHIKPQWMWMSICTKENPSETQVKNLYLMNNTFIVVLHVTLHCIFLG